MRAFQGNESSHSGNYDASISVCTQKIRNMYWNNKSISYKYKYRVYKNRKLGQNLQCTLQFIEQNHWIIYTIYIACATSLYKHFRLYGILLIQHYVLMVTGLLWSLTKPPMIKHSIRTRLKRILKYPEHQSNQDYARRSVTNQTRNIICTILCSKLKYYECDLLFNLSNAANISGPRLYPLLFAHL